MGRYYGESEERLRSVFEEAQQNAPSIIFIDELDSIAPSRSEVGEVERRVVAQLLTLMDGLEARENVVVIAATNRPEALDEALRRPGRFDREIVVGVPDLTGRREILGIQTARMPLADDVDLDALARRTERYSGADLENLVRKAGLQALREDLGRTDVPMRFFEEALKETRPSVTPEVEREYERLAQTLREARSPQRRIGFQFQPTDGDG
jgi:transitional endoplasmic reticulum ATPase